MPWLSLFATRVEILATNCAGASKGVSKMPNLAIPHLMRNTDSVLANARNQCSALWIPVSEANRNPFGSLRASLGSAANSLFSMRYAFCGFRIKMRHVLFWFKTLLLPYIRWYLVKLLPAVKGEIYHFITVLLPNPHFF